MIYFGRIIPTQECDFYDCHNKAAIQARWPGVPYVDLCWDCFEVYKLLEE